MKKNQQKTDIVIPNHFNFHINGEDTFEHVLETFLWDIKSSDVDMNLSKCDSANYQALSLLVLYLWHLKISGNRINVIKHIDSNNGATNMWLKMGASNWDIILQNEYKNFNFDITKPLLAVRTEKDLFDALKRLEMYTKGFNVEYSNTLRRAIAELLYNTLEHGKSILGIPSIIQFNWYRKRNELSILIADLGVGVKNHLENHYPAFHNDADAILKAIQPRVSGTFGKNPEDGKDNAGYGLFISSEIMRKLNAHMYIFSGSGVVHITPSTNTSKKIQSYWPGTFIKLSIKLTKTIDELELLKLMTSVTKAAEREWQEKSEDELIINIKNNFGEKAELKSQAISFRDREILPAINSNKDVVFEFGEVQSSTHSFISALLATPTTRYGIMAYKKFKFPNCPPVIREIIDLVLFENTNNVQK